MADDTPRILGGRYEVGELIGRGGMAEVHIGHDTRLGRTVAIKILRSDLARDPSFQARFRREAQAAASLNHPSIVAVYDTGEDIFTEANGGVGHVPFIVMEYVEGHTVRDILRDGAAVPIEEALEITAGVLSALEYSHHAGIVHRDIKPANVMLTPTGAVKVMDFGIARAMADAAGTMTQTQAVIGTAQYLSPEQARGEAVDARSDLYSTGCLLFELLTGRPPFIGDSPVAVAYQHAREEAQPPSTFASDVPEGLDRITMKALAKDRENRYSSAAEFRSEIEAASRGGHINAPAVGAASTMVMGAGAIAAAGIGGPPTAATQVLGGGASAAQALPAAAPWSQVSGDPVLPPPRRAPDPEPEERRRPWLPWLLVLIALAAIGGIAYLLTQGDPPDEPTNVVQVPDVVGMDEETARTTLEAEGLGFKPTREANAAPEGQVVATTPAAGEEVEEGVEVAAVVSSGPGTVEMPELSGLTESQAEGELLELGFSAQNISGATEDSTNVPKDRVTRTEPAVGAVVSPNDPVTIYRSTGQVQLPNLVNLTEEEARNALVALELVPTVATEENAEVEAGRVIRQSVTPGPVAQRSPVEIVVAATPAVKNVVIPDIEGLRWDQVVSALENENLVAEAAGEEFSATIPDDRATRSEPAKGTTVPEGTVVRVFMSKGPDPGDDDPPPTVTPTPTP